jgi:hypothetical protein
MLLLAGLIEYVQVVGADVCETVKVLPATVAVPVRKPEVFGETVNATDPLPDLPVPFWKVMNPLVLVALHAQPVWVVTEIEPLPPAAGMLALAGLIV